MMPSYNAIDSSQVCVGAYVTNEALSETGVRALATGWGYSGGAAVLGPERTPN